jgi:hypothetical protein
VGWENKFNTKFGCENMACKPLSNEPFEMLLVFANTQIANPMTNNITIFGKFPKIAKKMFL